MISPIAYADSLRIGTVDYVSPDEIKVMLDIDSPGNVALNAGSPRPFPRINSYVLIPSERGFLVGQIGWITIERSAYPKRGGMHDFGEIDLPYPLRKMSLSPLGMLGARKNENGSEKYSFSRGIEAYPTVGDPVVIPTNEQLRSIVESGENRRVNIGVSPLAENAVVSIDPDRLFGRHLAVLGNTGSGKSCSVAGLIRWSVDAAQNCIREKQGEPKGDEKPSANMRFIILDPNGEYSSAFSDMENVHRFAVESNASEEVNQMKVPLWLWNTEEWCSFTRARPGAQRPVLVQALRSVRDQDAEPTRTPSSEMRHYLGTLVTAVFNELGKGSPWKGTGNAKGFRTLLTNCQEGLVINAQFSEGEIQAIKDLIYAIDVFISSNVSGQIEWPLFSKPNADILFNAFLDTYHIFGGSDTEALPIDADIPRVFHGEHFLRNIEAYAELMHSREYVETMISRIRTLLADSKLKPIISSADEEITLENWLMTYISSSNEGETTVNIIDLSLVPAEISHIIAAVISRMILEALQRYRKMYNGQTLPTTIVMEEAHTFIKRYSEDQEEYTSASTLCTRIFEKIAREGRKFGLGLVLSSQRPSELSPTVLSQCNTFLLHRISNDKDQELVQKLVPDNLRGLLRELPSLPSRNAILLGWASELPVLVQMNYLKKEHQPASKDPEYWDTWIGEKECEVDWKKIADAWQQNNEIDVPINMD